MKKIMVVMTMTAAGMAAQGIDVAQEPLRQAQQALERARPALESLGPMLDRIGTLDFGGYLAFAPQSDAQDRAREAQERAREAQDRVREAQDRVRENDDRNISLYRDGTNAVDEGRYERAIDRFDRVIENKWYRADGAYYWKAYALNKLGKRDEALAALAEIPKQFPQTRWTADANALKVEIEQAAGHPVSPESQANEDLRLLAINSLMNSEPERAIPLLEKVLNDPKNTLGIKSRALFVLAQTRNDKAREIVARYAKSGSNPDLQIRAVTYLGTFRSESGQQVLADVYASVNDVAVKRAVLRSMMVSRDTAHLLNAAKSEQNPDLRREAISQLGALRATNELAQLYASETNADAKEAIIQAEMMGRDTDHLIEIARSEKDAKLRGRAIRNLGMMRNDKAAAALAGLYQNESDKTVKADILNALWMDGAAKQLVEINRNEKDPELKRDGVQMLGRMRGSKEATDYLLELINK